MRVRADPAGDFQSRARGGDGSFTDDYRAARGVGHDERIDARGWVNEEPVGRADEREAAGVVTRFARIAGGGEVASEFRAVGIDQVPRVANQRTADLASRKR